jgi:hypothetical protein
MKKFYLFAAFALLVSASINGMNQFQLSPNDTVRIHPSRLGGYSQQLVTMVTDGYCDAWSVTYNYPDGICVKLVAGVTPLSGMTVNYTTYTGEWTTYEAELQVSAAYGSIAATTSAMYGYWDFNEDGIYEPYGTVKWVPGYHEMYSLNLAVDEKFRCGWLTMDCTFNSSMDARGSVLSNVRCYKKTWVWVGYRLGDLNGDERVNVSDVTILISAVLNNSELDEFQSKAADENGDGEVNITDATRLIATVSNQ